MIEEIGRFELGDRKKHKQYINAVGFDGENQTGFWFSFASVYVKMKDEEQDSQEGIELLNLILAAPDMLRALQEFVDYDSDLDALGAPSGYAIVQAGIAAINKAKGIK